MIKSLKSVHIFVGLILSILLVSVSYAQIFPYDSELIEDKYKEEVEARRAREEAAFRNKETTLLADDYFENFTGLNYFPVDLKYRVVGKLTRLPQSERMNLDLTDGTPYGFMHYGKLNFFLEGQAVELMVFEFPTRADSGPTAIFVPFTDLTTGEENFGGGRFMIIKIPRGDQIVVDFNLAINPICVYDPEHACPVSPKANYIPKKILAGAKMYYDPESERANN
jgi:uncharacterized protein